MFRVKFSIFFFFFKKSGEAYRWRVCYQRRLSPLVYELMDNNVFRTTPGFAKNLRSSPLEVMMIKYYRKESIKAKVSKKYKLQINLNIQTNLNFTHPFLYASQYFVPLVTAKKVRNSFITNFTLFVYICFSHTTYRIYFTSTNLIPYIIIWNCTLHNYIHYIGLLHALQLCTMYSKISCTCMYTVLYCMLLYAVWCCMMNSNVNCIGLYASHFIALYAVQYTLYKNSSCTVMYTIQDFKMYVLIFCIGLHTVQFLTDPV